MLHFESSSSTVQTKPNHHHHHHNFYEDVKRENKGQIVEQEQNLFVGWCCLFYKMGKRKLNEEHEQQRQQTNINTHTDRYKHQVSEKP